MMTVLREGGAVVAGFVAMMLAVFASMGMAGVLMHIDPAHPTLACLVTAIVLSGIGGVVGGAVCAWLAGRAHPRTTPALALLVAVLGVVSALNAGPGEPLWFAWATPALGVAGVLFGALFWTRGRR